MAVENNLVKKLLHIMLLNLLKIVKIQNTAIHI